MVEAKQEGSLAFYGDGLVIPIPSEVQDLQSLLRWLIRTRHNETPYQMARHLKVNSAGILYLLSGKTKQPRGAFIKKLCDTYDLEPAAVRALMETHPHEPIDPSVRDFKALIQWLADKHHDGVVSRMHLKIGVSRSLPSFWKDGTIREPTPDVLRRLCLAYNLSEEEVLGLLP